MRRRPIIWCALLTVTFVSTAASEAAAASLQQVSNWTGGVANLPSDVHMYVYVPDKLAANPPVLTLIHSWGGGGGAIATPALFWVRQAASRARPTSMGSS